MIDFILKALLALEVGSLIIGLATLTVLVMYLVDKDKGMFE